MNEWLSISMFGWLVSRGSLLLPDLSIQYGWVSSPEWFSPSLYSSLTDTDKCIKNSLPNGQFEIGQSEVNCYGHRLEVNSAISPSIHSHQHINHYLSIHPTISIHLLIYLPPPRQKNGGKGSICIYLLQRSASGLTGFNNPDP